MNLREALFTMKLTSVPSKKELKSVYRQLAKKAHPDLTGTHQKFKNLRDAYDFLLKYSENKSKEKKIFPDALSRESLSQSVTINLTFEEGCLGALKKISFERIIMTTQSSKCDLCWGRGMIGGLYGKLIKCNVCNSIPIKSKTTKMVRVPAGIMNDQKMIFESEGHAVDNMSGRLIVGVKVRNDSSRERSGWDIVEKTPVTYSDLLLGRKIIAKTVHGDQRVSIPFGSFDGDVLRLKGKGVTTKKETGDHLVKLCLISPGQLSEKQKEALENLRKVGL